VRDQVGRGRRLQSLRAREDPASGREDSLVGLAAAAPGELVVAPAGEDGVRVRVHEPRQHALALDEDAALAAVGLRDRVRRPAATIRPAWTATEASGIAPTSFMAALPRAGPAARSRR